MTEWYCKECGQDSAETSTNCEICDAPRATAGVATYAEVPRNAPRAAFELDGQQVAYRAGDYGTGATFETMGDHG